MLPTPESPHWSVLVPVLLVLGCLGCAPANQEELRYDLQSCAEISVQGNVALHVQDGEHNRLIVRGPIASRDRVEQHAAGFVLKTLGAEDAVEAVLTCLQWGSFEALGATEVAWNTAPANLYKVALYGASAATLKRLDGQALDLRAAGASRLNIEQVLAEQIDIMAAGASELALVGATTSLSIEAAGSSVVNAGALQAQSVTVRASGAAVLDVRASAHLSGRIKSGVTLNVRGNPDRDLEMGGN